MNQESGKTASPLGENTIHQIQSRIVSYLGFATFVCMFFALILDKCENVRIKTRRIVFTQGKFKE